MDSVDVAVLLVNLVATWTMVGVIWFVQVVHYPLLSTVPPESASTVAIDHQRRTGQVVGLPMAAEGVTTLWLLLARPAEVSVVLPWIAAVFLAVALGCTLFLSVPRHARMASSPDAAVGRELVLTNWPRTVAWSARGVLVAVMAAPYASADDGALHVVAAGAARAAAADHLGSALHADQMVACSESRRSSGSRLNFAVIVPITDARS